MPHTTNDEAPPRVRTAGKFFQRGESKHWIKAVTYGPFEPRESDDIGLPPEPVMEADLRALAGLGANTVRVYEPPPTSFLDACTTHGLQVIVSVPWADHIDFLRDPQRRTEVVQSLKNTVVRYLGHPALLGYFVGNEIQATMVRWLGARKVKRLLEDLIDAGREVDPGALFSYANYPSTEYLNPDNADFVSYNVYLEDREAFENYVARLQNIAGDKPLLISEFGIDSINHGRNDQAQILRWHIDSAVACGTAGTTLFAYTDDWFRGGRHVEGWDFGLVDRERSPKPAFAEVRDRLEAATSPNRILLPTEIPPVSVIVCTYNGSRTLRECLTSLEKLDYPDYEVLVVDDGSDDETPAIIKSFGYVRRLHQDHGGLSKARNLGAAKARGKILAYTDDDCVADEHWISHLVATFDRGGYGAVGGPNISPPASSLTRACVAAAPGAPAHVLLTDRIAEHIPGCNLAVTREAFERIGGFMPEYRTAGDDVDFCWRLQTAGYEIGFSPGAMVW
ncbi:MAG: glycosyltransferase, partial [Verrucomicrobiales bacterium]